MSGDIKRTFRHFHPTATVFEVRVFVRSHPPTVHWDQLEAPQYREYARLAFSEPGLFLSRFSHTQECGLGKLQLPFRDGTTARGLMLIGVKP